MNFMELVGASLHSSVYSLCLLDTKFRLIMHALALPNYFSPYAELWMLVDETFSCLVTDGFKVLNLATMRILFVTSCLVMAYIPTSARATTTHC